MMGRPRKMPGTLTRHMTEAEQVQRKQEAEKATTGKTQLARAPTWLINDMARKEYNRIIMEMSGISVVGNLDLNNIAAYCNAYAMYRKATADLAKSSLTVEKYTAAGVANLVENPLIKIQRDYAEEMRKFARLCGLTIDSRLKIATMEVKTEAKELEDQFGDI